MFIEKRLSSSASGEETNKESTTHHETCTTESVYGGCQQCHRSVLLSLQLQLRRWGLEMEETSCRTCRSKESCEFSAQPLCGSSRGRQFSSHSHRPNFATEAYNKARPPRSIRHLFSPSSPNRITSFVYSHHGGWGSHTPPVPPVI